MFLNKNPSTSLRAGGFAPIAIILIVVGVLILAGGVYYYKINKTTSNSNQPPILGGDSDAHGCKGSAGYSWCDVKQKCLRVWEEKCEASSSTAPLSQNSASDWKIYTNDKYGFGVNYPPALQILENPPTAEAYLFSVSFKNPRTDPKAADNKIVFNVSVFKDNNQMQAAFSGLKFEDRGQILIDGNEAQKNLSSFNAGEAPFKEATVYTVSGKSTAFIFYDSDFSGVSQVDQDKILASFKFTSR